MRIAVPDLVSSTHIALIAEKELGIFRDEGQAVDIVLIPLMQALESLQNGAVDFCSGAADAPLIIFSDWRGVKLVAALTQGTHWMLVMRSGVAKRGEIDAVKGRRIAADRGPDLILKYLLRQAGIDMQGSSLGSGLNVVIYCLSATLVVKSAYVTCTTHRISGRGLPCYLSV